MRSEEQLQLSVFLQIVCHRVSVIVSVSIAPPPAEGVSVTVTTCPPLAIDAVDKSVAVMEDRELELEVTMAVDMAVAMLEVGGLELEVTEVVDVPVATPGLGIAGGAIGNVAFWAGHTEASRRTGQ